MPFIFSDCGGMGCKAAVVRQECSSCSSNETKAIAIGLAESGVAFLSLSQDLPSTVHVHSSCFISYKAPSHISEHDMVPVGEVHNKRKFCLLWDWCTSVDPSVLLV